jgi:D-arabinose 5-phosphate isomerase GutQ/beta-phosphoglucomutase-like phosphatase (HAD superfamily)
MNFLQNQNQNLELILDYDLFIFDFDGTLMDTEDIHHNVWIKALEQYTNSEKGSIHLTKSDYYQYFHDLNKDVTKQFLRFHPQLHIENIYEIYETIYGIKQKLYREYLEKNIVQFIKGADLFLQYLIDHKKKFIIVSNTSIRNLDIIKKNYPILEKAHKIYTKENFKNKKPNSECYIKISMEYQNEKKICFEDSLPGMEALYLVNNITPVFINNEEYYYTNYIIQHYPNIIHVKQFNSNSESNSESKLNLKELNRKIDVYHRKNNQNNHTSFIHSILQNNIYELRKNFIRMEYIIETITMILKNMNKNGNIYLTGMGKSGYVCKKCVSTWQSLSIKSSYIDLPNLPHGDFGTFRDGDVLIMISNSGNTDEIIYILDYLNKHIKKNITKISIVANKDSEMEKRSDYTFVLNDIKEADLINMTPSTSSLIFMSLLDGIAIHLKKNITKEEFQLHHPSGSLGKK